MELPPPSVALVVGVTGLAGESLVEALKEPNCLGGPWKVYGAARRRPMPNCFPSSAVDRFFTLDAVDFALTQAQLSPIAHEVTHLFWVTFQFPGDEEANIAINKSMLLNVLNALTASPSSRLTHVTVQTGTKHYMGPVHDPVRSTQLVCHEPPFHEDMPRLSYPNFYYALEDLVASYAPITYSVHRSTIIIGASARSLHNGLMVLACYAAVCRELGLPFRYPGSRYTWEHFCDMIDARVLAKQHVWAAVTDKAKNQAFNCTNGDVFSWKSMWRLLSELFDVEFVEFDERQEVDLVEFMGDKGKVWDEIVEKYGLQKTKLEEVAAFGAFKAVLHFGFQLVSSMNKNREYGFFEHVDTFKSVRFWVAKLKQMKFIP